MTNPQSREWRRNELALLAGLAVPVASIITAAAADVPFAGGGFESGKYTAPAIGWLETGTYDVVENNRLPGYPALIAAGYWLFGVGNDLALVLVQALLAAATVVFVARTAALIRSDLFWPGVVVAAITFNIGYRASIVLPDVLFTFLVAGAMLGLVATVQGTKPVRWLIWSGAFLGSAALTRPAFILVPLFTFPVLWFMLFRRASFGPLRAIAYTSIPGLTLVLFLAPWFAFTNHHLGKPVYSPQSGIHSLEWLYPCLQQPSGCGDRDPASVDRAQTLFEQRMEELPPAERADPLVAYEVKQEVARELILRIPPSHLLRASVLSIAKLMIHPSVLEFFERFDVPFLNFQDVPGDNLVQRLLALPGYAFTTSSMAVWLIAQLAVGLSRILQLVGVMSGLWDRRLRPAMLMLLAGSIPLIIVNVGIGNPRYRAPAEPYLAVLTLIGGAAVLNWWRRRASPEPRGDERQASVPAAG